MAKGGTVVGEAYGWLNGRADPTLSLHTRDNEADPRMARVGLIGLVAVAIVGLNSRNTRPGRT